MKTYEVTCECEAVVMRLSGEPRVRGFCHCEDCRDLLKVPYHSVTAWNPDQVSIEAGGELLETFQHPEKTMKRIFCSRCGESMYNTNKMDWRVVSQLLIRKSYNGSLPEELQSLSHFFYDRRIIDVDDDLPKKS